MEDCLFCKIVNKEIPSEVIFEDPEILAFRDISPQAPTHIVVIPKKHLRSAAEIDESNQLLAGKIIAAASKIAKELELDSYRLVFNCNESAGQTVFHLHCHLLGGRTFLWPPG